jgi:hypothetical protein
MTILRILTSLSAVALISCSSTPPRQPTFADEDMRGVWCASRDGGKTCWAYGEEYDNGTSDSCGLHPESGVQFAMTLTHKDDGPIRCDTVVKSSHPQVMPPGKSFCARLLSKGPDSRTYTFTDDKKIRTGYRRPRSEKWCQHLIDAL